jgi:hypothetical protein
MWISQGKSTMAGRFRFVQRIYNIIVHFLGGFESAIYNSAPKVAQPYITYFAIIQIYKSLDSEVEKYSRDEQIAETDV